MASLTKQCEDCPNEFVTSRANAKRCSVCRTLKDLRFVGDLIVECWLCDRKISPLEKGDKTCADCAYIPKKYGFAQCGFCKQERERIRADVAVCSECAHDPANRRTLILSLAKKQKTGASA